MQEHGRAIECTAAKSAAHLTRFAAGYISKSLMMASVQAGPLPKRSASRLVGARCAGAAEGKQAPAPRHGTASEFFVQAELEHRFKP